MFRKIIVCISLFIGLLIPSGVVLADIDEGTHQILEAEAIDAQQGGGSPIIGPIEGVDPGSNPLTTVQKYSKFEISFDITNRDFENEINPYFPHEIAGQPAPTLTSPSGTPVAPLPGISVDLLLIRTANQPEFPAYTDTRWNNDNAYKKLPCFYYQPVDSNLLPTGSADWHCRFTPEQDGKWWYKIRAKDSLGPEVETTISEFDCVTPINSNPKGFIKTNDRFFEYSNNEPFFYPLVNLEQGNPLDSLSDVTTNIQKLGAKGVRFVRWFPTEEGANYYIIPFGGDLDSSWAFGKTNALQGSGITTDAPDQETGHLFSFVPVDFTKQVILNAPSGTYSLTLRAKVTGSQNFTVKVTGGQVDQRFSVSPDGFWKDYEFSFNNNATRNLTVELVGDIGDTTLRATSNIRLNSVYLRRYETEYVRWGPNLLTRADPDTYTYIDQLGAARLDRVFELSESNGVYHKLPFFEKRDAVFNRIYSDGRINDPPWKSQYDFFLDNFYSKGNPIGPVRWYQQAYARYFTARWSYSPALHSLELANENARKNDSLCSGNQCPSYETGLALADYVHTTSPRHILMSNSFWGIDNWQNRKEDFEWFWNKPDIDYADKHYYANTRYNNGIEIIVAPYDDEPWDERYSDEWQDSVKYVNDCVYWFNLYRDRYRFSKPVVQGEGGVAYQDTGPQHTDLSRDVNSSYEHKPVYYHKKRWRHVGILGDTCDGEWYPRLFNSTILEKEELWKIYKAYEAFMQGEPISNGNYEEIGNDPVGGNRITINPPDQLRAWGVQDQSTGKTLLWIDNQNHTWWNVVQGDWNPADQGVTANITVTGFTIGQSYLIERWDTTMGQIVDSNVVTSQDGTLALQVVDLVSDFAVKIKSAASSTLVVNSTDDQLDSNPADCQCNTGEDIDGQPECTLRAAIQTANTCPGPSEIQLPAGTYTLAIPRTPGPVQDENGAAEGDLDVKDTLTLTGADATTTIIDGNQLDRVLHIIGNIDVQISNVNITNGQIPDGETGAGVYNDGGNLTIVDSIISDNLIPGDGRGGGIFNAAGSTVIIKRSEIQANTGGITYPGGGAGIYNEGTLLLEESTIDRNRASTAADGGGIYNTGNARMIDSTVSNNVGAAGGGLFNSTGTLTLKNSTISNNTSRFAGGGIFNDGAIDMTHVTISHNSGREGVGIHHIGGSVTWSNSIVANSIGNPGTDCNVALPNQTSSLDSDGSCGASTTANPMLGPLADNGGSTQTHALQVGSPAVDAADPGFCPATDQLGVDRPIDGNGDGSAECDLGAFELMAVSDTASPGTTAQVSVIPTTAGKTGILATLTNTAGGDATIIVANYATNPTSLNVFALASGFVDLSILGADSSDSVTANFYYGSDIIGTIEDQLQLLYFTGTGWDPVYSSGDAPPDKNSTDDLDGTVSGGRFGVTFDDTSTPSITQLTGTVFAMAVPESSDLLVTKTEDTADGSCDTADCSLREAIIAANANLEINTIIVPAGTYLLTLAGQDEDAAATGDLDITADLTISGAGAESTIIDGNQLDRVFQVLGADVDIVDVTIRNGDTSVGGGGIRNDNGTLHIASSKITANLDPPGFSGANGGGIYNAGQLILENSEVTHNAVELDVLGGGIYNESGTASVINSIISNNVSAAGAGIYNQGTLSVSGSTFDNNYARFTGGGISNDGGVLAVTDSTLSNNSEGAGIRNTNSGTTTISNTTIIDHIGYDSGGGGIVNGGNSTLTLINSTVTGNRSQNLPGGVSNAGTLFVVNSTINDNTAEDPNLAGGLSNGSTGTAEVTGSIIANNSSADCAGTITDGGYNLDSDGTCGTAITADPLLAPLADNGGSTPTQALQFGSPAIDQIPAAQCPVSTDQRGVIRPQGAGCDIGAFEFNVLLVTKTEDTADGSCDAADCSLREAIIAANTTPGHDLISVPAGAYLLTIDGPDEDAAATGDLDITDDVTISGAGAESTIIDGNHLDRVFHVLGTIKVNMAKVAVQNGDAQFEGGGIKNDQGYLHITESLITQNYATDFNDNLGAGISNSGVLTVEHSILSDNTAIYSNGGGLYNSHIATLIASTVKDNNAGSGGGVHNTGTLLLDKSTLNGNWSRFGGGGIATEPGSQTTLINSTVSDNEGRQGAGIYNVDGGYVRLESSTVSGNTGFVGPGEGIFNNGTAELVNTIVANNAIDCTNLLPLTSLGHNLDSDGSCGLSGPGDLSGIDPLLKPLADNGGLTATQALQANSPALDTGDNAACPAQDQRGQLRPKDGDGDGIEVCDIGAFELQQSAQLVNSSLGQQGMSTSYNPTPVENAPAGVFTISASFTNISSTPLTDIFFKVVALSGGNLVLNADGGPGGVGATVSVPGDIQPVAAFTVNFEIGLQARRGFSFFVDAYGIPANGMSATALSESSASDAGFQFDITDAQLEAGSGTDIYLPLIVK